MLSLSWFVLAKCLDWEANPRIPQRISEVMLHLYPGDMDFQLG